LSEETEELLGGDGLLEDASDTEHVDEPLLDLPWRAERHPGESPRDFIHRRMNALGAKDG